ncbi:MAG: helix-turn-helix domain-containing protein [Oscillospiraceae bacterium]|nr:helix-turn-helix domain-containing protein [Oscillospiraceae bacterium]
MASRIFQSMVVQMKEATQRPIGVVDSEGNVVASTDLAIMGTHIADGQVLEGMAGEKFAVIAGKTFRPLSGSDTHFDYAVFVEGTDELAQSYAVMAAVAVQSAKNYYEEKYDRSALVKNIITENILPGDIYVHAKELHFVPETARGVFYIRELSRSDIAAVDALRRVFPDRERDFVISINESDICVIKELNANACEEKDLIKVAREIEKAIGDDLKIKCVIGIGSVALHLRDLAARYKEAQIAIEVGKVFDTEKSIISYESLGIGRLIYQLPTTMCEMFLQEVFKKNPIDSLDEETLSIIAEFFDNNLNISETSRKLFVHRNTLVYRLGKIKKMTGLDLREFDQAIVFKVALMVKKYLNSQKA